MDQEAEIEEMKSRIRRLEQKIESLTPPRARKPRESVKPLTQHEGLLGALARKWKGAYGYEPTWGAGEVIALRKKRSVNSHLKDTVYAVAFDVYLEKDFWAQLKHPLSMFVRHLDTFLAEVKPDPEDYQHGA